MKVSFPEEIIKILRNFDNVKNKEQIKLLDILENRIYQEKKKLKLESLKLEKYLFYILNYIESYLFYNLEYLESFLSQMIEIFLKYTNIGNQILDFANQFQIVMLEWG